VLRYFFISCLMLIVPVAEVWWFTSLDTRPLWQRVQMLLPLLLLWLASGITGIFFGFRSCRLANRKTDGFGILAVLLHVCSLLLWTVLVGGIYRVYVDHKYIG
jgi:hypothetical protein